MIVNSRKSLTDRVVSDSKIIESASFIKSFLIYYDGMLPLLLAIVTTLIPFAYQPFYSD